MHNLTNVCKLVLSVEQLGAGRWKGRRERRGGDQRGGRRR